LDTDPRTAELVRTIVLMGANLGLKLIAEGIETTDQRDHLHRLGCTYGQGYLFAKPLPSALAVASTSGPAAPGDPLRNAG
jgi:EAL domain-containing protein (putative c-di-GMP-specific phosphodiesterase class I)